MKSEPHYLKHNSDRPFEMKRLLLWEFCSWKYSPWLFDEVKTNDLLNWLIYLSEPERKVSWCDLKAIWFLQLQSFLEYIQKVLDMSQIYGNEEQHKSIQESLDYFLNALNKIKTQDMDYKEWLEWLYNLVWKKQCPERILNELRLLLNS